MKSPGRKARSRTPTGASRPLASLSTTWPIPLTSCATAWGSNASATGGSSSGLCSPRHARHPPKPERSSGARCAISALSMPAPSTDLPATVHVGYTSSRQAAECSGHWRTPPVPRNPRSARVPSHYQRALWAADRSSSLPTRNYRPSVTRWRPLGTLPHRCAVPRLVCPSVVVAARLLPVDSVADS
jgi:hypothetical protein